MKKILTLALAAFGSMTSAFAAPNGNIDLLGTKLIVESQISNGGNGTRPDGFSYTMPDGDSTGLFVVFQESNNGSYGDFPDSIFYGGVMMSPSFNTTIFTNTATSDKLNIYVFFLTDSAAATRTSNIFDVYYNAATPAKGGSYMFTVFTLDEVSQTPPLLGCSAQQTGGNLNTGDSLSCATGGTITGGDMLMVLGGSGKTTAGPLKSNFPDTIINRQSGSMWASIFADQVPTTQFVVPYVKATGQAGRFILLATIIHNINTLNGGGTNLPVKLTKFEARNQYNGNNVSWTTATESNVKNFEVQMSADGKDFNTVGYVSPNTGGNTTTPQEYSYVDAVRATKSYYRLKTVDMDGSFTYSQIVTVTSGVRTAPDMSVYPNPSTGTFTVSINTADAKIRVINAMGQEVGYTVLEEATAPRSMTVKLNSTTPGFYYVMSESAGASSTAKVFVQ